MSKSIVVGSTLAVLGLGGLAFGAWQVQQDRTPEPQFAEILGVEAVTRTVERPREVCEDVEKVVNVEVPVEVPVQVPVTQAAPADQAALSQGQDPHRIVGTAAGALVGGLLGNQVGGGSGKKIATVAGAIGGALAGREVQSRVEAHQRAQAGQPQAQYETRYETRYETQAQTITERECHTVMESHEEPLGYDVTYRVDGEEMSRRMETPPQAERLPVMEGEVQWQADLEAQGEAQTQTET